MKCSITSFAPSANETAGLRTSCSQELRARPHLPWVTKHFTRAWREWSAWWMAGSNVVTRTLHTRLARMKRLVAEVVGRVSGAACERQLVGPQGGFAVGVALAVVGFEVFVDCLQVVVGELVELRKETLFVEFRILDCLGLDDVAGDTLCTGIRRTR